MMWLWITIGCLIIAVGLWGICAGGGYKDNDDAYQMAAIEAWEAKKAAKDARRNHC